MNNIKEENNNIYIENQVSTYIYRLTNNIYKKVLFNDNYLIMIYLLLNKNYTYKAELVKRKDNSWQNYFKVLLKNNIIEEYKLNPDELGYLSNKQNMGKYQVDKAKFYTLTQEAKDFFNKEEVFHFIFNSVDEELKQYCRYEKVMAQHTINKLEVFTNYGVN